VVTVEAPRIDTLASSEVAAEQITSAVNDLVEGKQESEVVPGVDAIISNLNSEMTSTALAAVRDADRHVLLISPNATSSHFTYASDEENRFFRTAPSDVLQVRRLATEILAQGDHRATIIQINDIYGNRFADAFTASFSAAGGTVVARHRYPPDTDPSLTTWLPAISADGQDAIVLIGYTDDTSQLVKALHIREFSESNPDLALWTVDGGVGVADELVDSPDILNGLQMVQPAPAQLDPTIEWSESASTTDQNGNLLPQWVGEAERLTELFEQVTYTPNAYDAVAILALAARLAGCSDPAIMGPLIVDVTRSDSPSDINCKGLSECTDALRNISTANIDYDGFSGPLNFSMPGEPTITQYLITISERARPVEQRVEQESDCIACDVNLLPKIEFPEDSAVLDSRYQLILDLIRYRLLDANDDLVVQIDGYATSPGERKENFDLSQDRADAVQDQLIALGVPSSRLRACGNGELDEQGRAVVFRESDTSRDCPEVHN
jgi:branched-chain amino acid transport system substrate-binding protein